MIPRSAGGPPSPRRRYRCFGRTMTRAAVSSSLPAAMPSVHIRVVITWLAIFPLVTLVSIGMAPLAHDWNPVMRALVLSALVVPTAVYLVVPRLLRGYGKLRRIATTRRASHQPRES